MSAGDVKFIGWQGTNPSYQELEPSISYEPFRQFQNQTSSFGNLEIGQYVRAKVTRTVIVFSKDKDTFINGLDFLYNTLNLTYVDSNGSIGTKAYGNGWELTTIDESPAARGYTQIRLSYEKAIAKSLAFFGVDGLSVDCLNGVCRIRYKGNNLETIDSGTGVCTSGLQLGIERLNPPSTSSVIDETFISELKAAPYYRVQVLCNDVISDVTELVGSDLPVKDVVIYSQRQNFEEPTFSNTYSSYFAASDAANAFIFAQTWTQQEVNQTIEGIKSSYPDSENIKTTVRLFQNPEIIFTPTRPILTVTSDGSGFQSEQFIAETKVQVTIKRYVEITRTAKIPNELIPSTLYTRWQKLGNTISLVFGGFSNARPSDRTSNIIQKNIREYDVTGL
jgi:hypothetical protein